MANTKKIRYFGYVDIGYSTSENKYFETMAEAIKQTKDKMHKIRKAYMAAQWFVHSSTTGKCVAAGGIYNDGTRYRIRAKGSLMLYDNKPDEINATYED